MDAVKTAHTSRARRIQSKYRVPAATMTQSNGGTRQCDRARAHAAAEGVQTARAPLLVCRISTFRSILLPESCPTSISGSQRPQPSSVHLTRTCGTAWHRGEATFPHKVSEPEVPSRTFNQVAGGFEARAGSGGTDEEGMPSFRAGGGAGAGGGWVATKHPTFSGEVGCKSWV